MARTFEAYQVALELMTALRPVVEGLAKRNRSLADQVRRAAASVPLNLAESNRRAGQDRIQHFRIAAGSAAAVRAALQVAWAWGDAEPCPMAEALLDRLLAMLWRLTHPRRE